MNARTCGLAGLVLTLVAAPVGASAPDELKQAMAAGDCAKARPLIDAALAQSASDHEAWLALGVCRSKAGEYAAALEAADRAVKASPKLKNDAKLTAMVGRWRMLAAIAGAASAAQAGEARRGVGLLQSYLSQRGRRCPSVLGLMALLQEATGARAVAAVTARQALAARCADDVPAPAESALNHVVIANTAMASKQYAAATAAAKRAIAMAPNDSKAAELAYEILFVIDDEKSGPRPAPQPVYMSYGSGPGPSTPPRTAPPAAPSAPASKPAAQPASGPKSFRCTLHCWSSLISGLGPALAQSTERASTASSAQAEVYRRMGSGACRTRFGKSGSHVLAVECRELK